MLQTYSNQEAKMQLRLMVIRWEDFAHWWDV